MGRRVSGAIAGLMLLAPLVFACAPRTAPSPVPAAPSQGIVPETRPASSVPVPTSQDAAWTKVIEAARKEGKLTLYSFNFTGDLGLMLQKAFRQRYGIELEIITGRGSEFIERLKTEKRVGQRAADATEGSAVNVKTMKLEGLTVSVATELPALSEKGMWLIDPVTLDPQDKHLISFFLTTYAPHINNRLVRPGEEPKRWRELLDPKWKGKMSITDHNVSSLPYYFFTSLLREKIIDIDYIKALYTQELRYSPSLNDEALLLARGETHIMVGGNDSTSARLVAEGAPIRVAEMQDGTILSPGAAAAIAGAPHPNAAKVFMNWLMSQEGQRIHGEGKKMGSVRTDVQDFRPEAMKFVPRRPVVITVEDNEESTRLFREKWINKLIGK